MNGRSLVFFIPSHSWGTLFLGSLTLSIAVIPWYAAYSRWLGLATFVIALALGHSVMACRNVPWFPGLIIGMASLQWVLAPWAQYSSTASRGLPPLMNEGVVLYSTGMALPPGEYFPYAVQGLIAMIAGMYVPLLREGGKAINAYRIVSYPATLRATCELMVLGGIVVRVLQRFAVPAPFLYVSELVANLAFVGAIGLYLTRSPGWRLRVFAAFAPVLYVSSATAQFLDLFLWGMYLAVIATFVNQYRVRRMVVTLVVGVFVVFTLNGIKANYRERITVAENLSLADYTRFLSAEFVRGAAQPGQVFVGENLRQNMSRFNQGWIIARVMHWVPASEPYAKGETIAKAASAALLPRFLAPDKYVAGGGEHFGRFTGFSLIGSTSMNLSMSGEAYANFGHLGGVLLLFFYGMALGHVYRFFLRLAGVTVLWWAWAPFVLLWTVSAESGLGEVLNQVVKSGVVMLAVATVVPGWRELRLWQLLFGRPAAARISSGSSPATP